MKIDVYSQKGEKIGSSLLPKELFDVRLNSDLLHQVVVSQMANRRRVIAHTKDRSQVRGGGRKPWRQKGTGRARHGSRRSPIWRGGGVTFGPTKEKVFKKTIPKKMKRKAVFMVLSAKAKNNLLVLLDNLTLSSPKTKVLVDVLKKLPCKNESVFIMTASYDKNILLSARNISDIGISQAKDINALDLLSYKYLLTTKEAIKVIKETFIKRTENSESRIKNEESKVRNS